MGAYESRKIGFKNSIGSYIGFIDSDDDYKSNFLKIMMENLVKNSSDIVQCNFDSIENGKKIENDFLNMKHQVFSNVNVLMALYKDVEKWPLFLLWNKIFKREIIENVMNELNSQEPLLNVNHMSDLAPSLLSLYYAKKFVSINDSLVDHNVHSDQATQITSIEKLISRNKNCFNVFLLIKNIFKEKIIPTSFWGQIENHKIHSLKTFLDEISHFSDEDEKNIFLTELIQIWGFRAMNIIFHSDMFKMNNMISGIDNSENDLSYYNNEKLTIRQICRPFWRKIAPEGTIRFKILKRVYRIIKFIFRIK